jgi:parallel beta-helix repeat protein
VEVPGPSAALYASPFYSCTRNFYVSTAGNDSNPGTQAQPWLTIQNADSSARTGGDCINVAAGKYQANVLIQHGGTGPTANGYVVYRCMTLDACHVLAPGSGHLWGFKGGGSFVVVDGFELDGNNAMQTDGIADTCIATDDATYGSGNSSYQAGDSSHHIWVLNNLVHHCNLGGIGLNNKEWFYAVHNTVYHNAWTSGYQGSGIGFVVVQCIEQGGTNCYTSGPTGDYDYVPSGNDLSSTRPGGYAPFHIVIAWNIVYNNRIAPYNPVGCGSHTDGNGIIADTFLDGYSNTLQFPYQSLIANNVSFYNGGRGVHVFRTSNVTIANNTAYNNGTDYCLDAYYLGDLSNSGGSNNLWINNVAQSVLTPVYTGSGSCTSASSDCGNRNAPLVAGNGAGFTDTNNMYINNTLFGGDGVQLFNNDVNYFSSSDNDTTNNPLFVSVTAGTIGANTSSTWIPGSGNNFALQSMSPLIGYGVSESYLPASDADAGACNHTLTTCGAINPSDY